MNGVWAEGLRKALIFVAAAGLFATGIWGILALNDVLTPREKAAVARLLAEERALAGKFEVLVLQAGFQRRFSGVKDIYVPCLLVQARNVSVEPSPQVILRASFTSGERAICVSGYVIPSLEPGKDVELWLRCVESVGFGAVVKGLSLAETTRGVEYSVTLEADRVEVEVRKGRLDSKFL